MPVQLDAFGLDATVAAIFEGHLQTLTARSAHDVAIMLCHRLVLERPLPEALKPYAGPGVARVEPHRDGGHVSGILAQVVDKLAQLSGTGERVQVVAAACAFHGVPYDVPRSVVVRCAISPEPERWSAPSLCERFPKCACPRRD